MVVRAHASSKIYWVVLLPLIAFASYIWDGIYIGLTAVKQMREAMLISLVIYLTFYYFFQSQGEEIIWWALILFLLIRGVLLTIYWYTNRDMIQLKLSVY